jgi:central kinetochore subunit Mal2/MCM21
VRIDVPNNEGQYDKPYYILAQRVAESSDELRIHRHTIPAFVPIRRYEEMYLPQQDEGYGSGDATSSQQQRQDMHGLLKHVRADLVSWTLRRDAIRNLQKQLRLPSQATDLRTAEPVRDLSVGMFGVRSLAATAVEATQIKIEWANGAVGRLRISDRGTIERAVIYDHAGRMKEVEMMLTRDTSSILELASRLEAVYVHFQEDDDEDMDDNKDERSDRTTP